MGGAFAVRLGGDFRPRCIEIGFEHREGSGDAPLLRERVMPFLRERLPGRVTWEMRNETVVFAIIELRADAMRGVRRHAAVTSSAAWRAHEGDFFKVAWSGREGASENTSVRPGGDS